MTEPPHDPDHDCWGCRAEPSVEETLGEQCRRALADRRVDPATPKLNEMIAKLESPYERLCWSCRYELAVGIGGLCPRCEHELRR